MNIDFITLRRRTPTLLQEVYGLPRSAWRRVELDVPTRQYRTPRIYEQRVKLAGHWFPGNLRPGPWARQADDSADQSAPTPVQSLLTRYAHRMLIENSLSDAVRFFHLDALSSAVGLKVDFDMALLVVASGLYRLVGPADARLRGGACPPHLPGLGGHAGTGRVEASSEVRVEFHRRAHLPIVLASGLCDRAVAIPWWEGQAPAPDHLYRTLNPPRRSTAAQRRRALPLQDSAIHRQAFVSLIPFRGNPG